MHVRRDHRPTRQPVLDEHTLTCESSGARVIVGVYPAGTEFDTHEHREAYLCLTLEGEYHEWSPGSVRRRVVPGRPLVYREGSRHAVRTGAEPVHIVHVTDPRGAEWDAGVAPLAGGILWQLGVAARRGSGLDDAATLHVDSLVEELGPRTDGEGDEAWLGVVLDQIRDGYRAPLSLSELAAGVGRHPAHVARAFRARWRMTAGEFLRRVRVAAAVRQITEGDESLSFIAIDCGFSDQSHMGRWIRDYIGLTPNEVRAAARAESSAHLDH